VQEWLRESENKIHIDNECERERRTSDSHCWRVEKIDCG